MDFYIYYKVETSQAQTLLEKVKSMQQFLSSTHGISTALKRRPAVSDNMQTWMEIYLAVPEDFDGILKRAVDDFGLSLLLKTDRHIEQFMDFDA